jgi:Ca2+-binding EF-hand superfamily protein
MRTRLALLAACFILPSFANAADEPDVFSRLDANSDGFVARDEVPADHVRLFERLVRESDKNGDGKLSREEFASGTAARPADPPASPAAPGGNRPAGAFTPGQFFKEIDRDGDGRISREEAPPRLKENFQRIDANGDGYLEPAEIAKAMPALAAAAAGIDPRRVEEILRKVDANGDGKITAEEVPAEQRERFQRSLERLDEDKDGALTREQFVRVLIEAGVLTAGNTPRPAAAIAEQTAAARIKQLDKDGDGKVSKSEAPERLLGVFEQIDENSDGGIDAAELRRFMEKLTEGARNLPRPEPKP